MDLLLPLLLLVVVGMLGYSTYRQSKRARQQREAINTLAPGTRVMLSNGFIGSVVSVDDTTMDVELAPGVVTTVVKQAYGQTLPAEDAEADEVADDADARPLTTDETAPLDDEPPTHRVVRDETAEADDAPASTGPAAPGPYDTGAPNPYDTGAPGPYDAPFDPRPGAAGPTDEPGRDPRRTDS
jgi:preprotein translocase subunit YajC